jgi:3-methyladenine DNA glycosylase AlkD
VSTPAIAAARIVAELRRHASPKNVAGMARYGISTRNTLGVPIPVLRALARHLRPDHPLALRLWRSGIHEARILATMIDDPLRVTAVQLERWLADLDSWDVCDQLCANLLEDVPLARRRMTVWARRKPEFIRRAGFVLMARIAVSDKGAADETFLDCLAFIQRNGADGRNMVRKGVNWAIRQIGKRNSRLHQAAVATAEAFAAHRDASIRWIGTDALREFRSAAVRSRLKP